MFIESSAKAGFNIKALFRKLANALPGMESAQAKQPATNLIDIKVRNRHMGCALLHSFATYAALFAIPVAAKVLTSHVGSSVAFIAPPIMCFLHSISPHHGIPPLSLTLPYFPLQWLVPVSFLRPRQRTARQQQRREGALVKRSPCCNHLSRPARAPSQPRSQSSVSQPVSQTVERSSVQSEY